MRPIPYNGRDALYAVPPSLPYKNTVTHIDNGHLPLQPTPFSCTIPGLLQSSMARGFTPFPSSLEAWV